MRKKDEKVHLLLLNVPISEIVPKNLHIKNARNIEMVHKV